MTTKRLHAWVICVAAVVVAVASHAFQPTELLAQRLGDIDLEAVVPDKFGKWRRDASSAAGVVDPQAKAFIDSIYTRTLARVYVADDGYRIMLSIAYSRDHSDNRDSFHRPEICYPASGFNILDQSDAKIATTYGNVSARRLVTRLGAARPEPVTYWVTIGEHAVVTGMDRKLASLRYTSRGLIPDGLLFRVSSIDPNPGNAFARQDQFIRDFVAALPASYRRRIAGLGDE
jgi:EpsI family protein